MRTLRRFGLLVAMVAWPLLLWQHAFDLSVRRHVEELVLSPDAQQADARRARALARLDELGDEALPAVIATFGVTAGELQRGVTLQRSGLSMDAGPLVNPAMGWLRSRPGPATVEALIDALDDDNLDVRHFAGLTLAWIGTPAVPALVGTLRTGDTAQRAAAAFALSFMGEEGVPAIPALQEALQHPDKDVHYTARYAIQQLSPGNEGFWEAVEAARRSPAR